MRRESASALANIRCARSIWGRLPSSATRMLKVLTQRFTLSVGEGHLLFLDGTWYITHSGLLRIAQKRRCSGITTVIQDRISEPKLSRWVFKATVYKSSSSRGFVGYGDADPSNVSSLVHGAEMRVAETRAVNRALRKAYGIGLCSVEELGWAPRSFDFNSFNQGKASANGSKREPGSQPRLRDRLCLLIRQYQLDAGLVKAYAADFCKTPTLRDASREQVEAFINELAESAANDRDALICRLNSYAKQPEVNS